MISKFVLVAAGAATLLAFAGGMSQAQESGGEIPAYFTEEQADRGETAFLTNCSGCHGYSMITTFSTYPDAFEFHSKISLTMPWEDPASLPEQYYIDMVAYFLRENGFPAGDAELEIDRALLEGIDPGAVIMQRAEQRTEGGN